MRLFSSLILLLLIMACNNSASKKADARDTAKAARQMPETPVLADTIFEGFSGEPVWSVYVIKNDKIIFQPGDGEMLAVPFVPAAIVDSITKIYRSAAGNNLLELLITKQDCSDRMSEITEPYSVELKVNRKYFTGCGRKE